MGNESVIISGATKGIGLAISKRLSKNGWKVIGLARGYLAHFPGSLYQCDLTSREDLQKILGLISEKETTPSAIINNVGIALPEELGSISLDHLDDVFDLNVRVAVQITQHFIARMKINRSGRIINIASRATQGSLNRTSYSAAKCALVGCTKTWALELAKYNILVNAVSPGPIETELFRVSRPIGSNEEKKILNSIPLTRIGQPSDIAGIVSFLLTNDANYITGQVISVDGGASL